MFGSLIAPKYVKGQFLRFEDEWGELVEGKVFRVDERMEIITLVTNNNGVSYIWHYGFDLFPLGACFSEAKDKQLMRLKNVGLQDGFGI